MYENFWEILGIAPTPDEKIIKKAYASLLKDNKPDKNPEGFKRLRQAYDEALAQRYWYMDGEDEDDDIFADETDDENLDINQIDNQQKPTVNLQKSDDEPIFDHSEPIAYQRGESPSFVVSEKKYNDVENFAEPELADDEQILQDWQNAWQEKTDNELVQILMQQFAQLNEQSLDFFHDYEISVLHFLYNDEQNLAMSYGTSFEFFAWQQYLNSWQAEYYPYSLLQALDKRYHTVAKFAQGDIKQILNKNFPDVYDIWQNQKFGRWLLIKNIKDVPHIHAQLQQLNDEIADALQLQTANESKTQTQQNIDIIAQDTHLKQLNHWLGKRLFYKKDVLYLAIICATIFAPFAFFNLTKAVNSAILLWIGVLLYMGLLQLIFWFITNPAKFTAEQDEPTITRGVFGAGLLLFLAFYSEWNKQAIDWAIPLYQPSYYITHGIGFLVWAYLQYAEQEKHFINTQIAFFQGFVLAILAVGIPLIFMSLGFAGKNDDFSVVPISPWFWWVFSLVNICHVFFGNYPKIHQFFINVGTRLENIAFTLIVLLLALSFAKLVNTHYVIVSVAFMSLGIFHFTLIKQIKDEE